MIGLLGDVRFRVRDGSTLTFKNLKREISTTWNKISRIGLKPLVEYGGPNLQMVTLEIMLDAGLGVKPVTLLKKLEAMTESANAYDFVLGKRRIGKNPWTITKCSQAYDIILRRGEVYRATVFLTLQEYV